MATTFAVTVRLQDGTAGGWAVACARAVPCCAAYSPTRTSPPTITLWSRVCGPNLFDMSSPEISWVIFHKRCRAAFTQGKALLTLWRRDSAHCFSRCRDGSWSVERERSL